VHQEQPNKGEISAYFECPAPQGPAWVDMLWLTTSNGKPM